MDAQTERFSDEKYDDKAVEEPATSSTSLDVTSPEFKAREKRLVRKQDFLIMPLTILLYLLAYLDRGNAGNAKLQGLFTQILDSNDTHFSVIFCTFYVAYILFNIPGTVFSRTVRPNISIALACLLWGIASSCQAAVHTYGGLIAARFFLGVGEAGFGAAIPLYYSYWYKKNEIGFRNGFFISAGALSGAFGGLIAFGVAHIKHPAIDTWRVLFLIEGLPTIMVSLVIFLFLPTLPYTSKFLSEDERQVAVARLQKQGLTETWSVWGFDKSGAKRALTDWKAYTCGLLYLGVNLTLGSVSGFLPTIVKTLGYSDAKAQLMTTPPYAAAFVSTCAVAVISDRLRLRGPFVAGAMLWSALGFAILLGETTNQKVRYFAVFLPVMGCYSTIPLMLSWQSNNSGSQSQRAVNLAMLNAIGQCFSILASFIFPSSEAPRWRKGFGINLAFNCSAAIIAICLTIYYRHENARRDRVEGGRPEDESKLELTEKHDLAPGFRYTR